jgi:hypothetical protein
MFSAAAFHGIIVASQIRPKGGFFEAIENNYARKIHFIVRFFLSIKTEHSKLSNGQL